MNLVMLSDLNIMMDVRVGTQAEYTSNTLQTIYTVQYSYTVFHVTKFQISEDIIQKK